MRFRHAILVVAQPVLKEITLPLDILGSGEIVFAV